VFGERQEIRIIDAKVRWNALSSTRWYKLRLCPLISAPRRLRLVSSSEKPIHHNAVAELRLPAVDTTAATALRWFFARYEKSAGCNCIHLCHRHAGHGRSGVNRAGVAVFDS